MKKLLLLAIFLASAASATLCAQTFDLTHPAEPVMSLNGLWRFHPGDNLAWADPNFDDSDWPLLPSDRNWAQAGYPRMYGFGWYRFAVVLPAGLSEVSIKLPPIGACYELYANGMLIGTFGALPPHFRNLADSGLGETFKLPGSLASQQHIEFAIRVYVHEGGRLQGKGGARPGLSLIGASAEVARRTATDRFATLFHYSPAMLVILLELLAGTGAMFLYYQRRTEREYLWFGVLMLSRACYDFAVLYETLVASSILQMNFIRTLLFFCLYQLAELYFYKHLLKAAESKWFRLAVVCVLMNSVVAFSFLTDLSSQGLVYAHFGLTLFTIPYYVWVLSLVFRRARERYPDAHLLLVPAILQKLAQIWNRIGGTTLSLGWQHRFGILTEITTEPVRVDLVQLVNTLFLLAAFAILIRRFTRTRSQAEMYAQEFADAREVQRYLIPSQLPSTSGLAIASAYLPAREVGGDFFQVLPNSLDGSVLIVVGDVAGKGLQAGMLATLVVGAVRVAAAFTADPGKILAVLNERLQGRGLVTCLALRIERDGRASLANAGHLPPYRNGKELEVEGSLPLGVVGGIEFPVSEFHLDEGDELLLMSDGVVEAQDSTGQLFGFQRTEDLLAQTFTASSLAEAAQAFGQEDDITVLTVKKTAVSDL